MKNLEVSLVVRANNTNHAENIAMRELLELAKVIAKRNAGTMGQGSGSATPLASDAYQVNATVSIDSKGNVNDIIKDIQNVWMHKPEIVHSMFTVEEEKQETETNYPICRCNACGCAFNNESAGEYVNPGTKNEYWMCDDCIADKEHDGALGYCECCDHYIDALVENPVTHEKNICPCCGEII